MMLDPRIRPLHQQQQQEAGVGHGVPPPPQPNHQQALQGHQLQINHQQQVLHQQQQLGMPPMPMQMQMHQPHHHHSIGKQTSRRARHHDLDSDFDDASFSSISSSSSFDDSPRGKRKRSRNYGLKKQSHSASGGALRKKRKTKSDLVGRRALRRFSGFEHGCPVKVISYDADRGYQVMYSDGEMELVSDEEALDEIPYALQDLRDYEDAKHEEEHEHDEMGNPLQPDTRLRDPVQDPAFVAAVIRLLGKAKYNMTQQKYSSKIDDQNYPRYPTTSFGLFLASMMEREGDATAPGSEWASMDAEEKRPYYEQHKINMQSYKQAIEQYEPGPVEKTAINIFKRAKQSSARFAKKRSEHVNPGQQRPKRPMSAFLYFSQEERTKWLDESQGDIAGKSMRNFQAQAAIKWRSMGEEEKQRYQMMAQQDQTRYRGEMDSFAASDSKEMDGEKSIIKQHFERYIHTRIKALKKICKAATAAQKAHQRRQLIERKMQRLQMRMLKETQNHERWSYKVNKLREQFPNLIPPLP